MTATVAPVKPVAAIESADRGSTGGAVRRYEVMLAKKLFLALLAIYVVWLGVAYEYHFLDGVNLLFHEAGHVILGFMGTTIQFLGGTIGQLFFPIAAAFHFLQQGKIYEAWIMGIWLAESLMNVARYLGDAQAQALPLVGGHIHDWNWLLGRWGLLPYCESIAFALHLIATALAVGCLLAAWRSLTPDEDFVDYSASESV